MKEGRGRLEMNISGMDAKGKINGKSDLGSSQEKEKSDSLKAKKRNLIGREIEWAINPQGAADHAGMNTHTEDGIKPNPLPWTVNEVGCSNHSATSNSSLNNTVSTIMNTNGCLNWKKKKNTRTHTKKKVFHSLVMYY